MEFIEEKELAQVEGGWCPLNWIKPIIPCFSKCDKTVIVVNNNTGC